MKENNDINNKLLVSCTVGEFLDLAMEKLVAAFSKEEGLPNKRNLVYGIAGLAQLFSCSLSTAHRIKKSGIIDPAISQTGKIIVIDADLALDLMNLATKRRKRR